MKTDKKIEEIINNAYIRGFQDADSKGGLDFNHTNKYKKQANTEVQKAVEDGVRGCVKFIESRRGFIGGGADLPEIYLQTLKENKE